MEPATCGAASPGAALVGEVQIGVVTSSDRAVLTDVRQTELNQLEHFEVVNKYIKTGGWVFAL